MSQLGYIYSSYGKHFNIGIANTYGENVLSGSNLPKNSIIISSPIDKDDEDLGIYSLIATDNNGIPVRLSYTIQEGNGFKYDNDTIYFSIDENYLSTNDNQLQANLSYILDLDTLNIKNEKIFIDIDSLNKISSSNKGVFKIDDNTINIDNDTIFVNTQALDKSNNSTDTFGIGLGDGTSIIANNGIFSIDSNGLSLCNENTPGLVFTSSNKLDISGGVISIKTENLNHSNKNEFGICSPDNSTIVSNKGILSVNEDNLDKGSSFSYGLIKYDNSSINKNEDKLEVNKYDQFFSNIEDISSNIDNIDKVIDDIKYLLENYGFGLEKATIFKFYCATLLSATLEFPKYNEDPEEMPSQIVNIEFVINTNCPFNISIEYIDNVEPQITLYEINYADLVILQGNAGLSTSYQTTEERDLTLKFSFLCKNYYNNDDTEYSNNTNIKIRVTYDNDSSIYREVIYTIVRYNSGYSELLQKDDTQSDYVNAEKEPHRAIKESTVDTAFRISVDPINNPSSDQTTFIGTIKYNGNEGRTPNFSIEEPIQIISSDGTAVNKTINADIENNNIIITISDN